MIKNLLLIVGYCAAQATEEECLADKASFWDGAACTPCDEYTHADEAGTACISHECTATQKLMPDGMCEDCPEGEAVDSTGKACAVPETTTTEETTDTTTTDDTTTDDTTTDDTTTDDTTTDDTTTDGTTTDDTTTDDTTTDGTTTDDTTTDGTTTDGTTTDDTPQTTTPTRGTCPEGEKADPLGKCRPIVSANLIRTNLRLNGDFDDFVQDTFKSELEGQLGVTVSIIDAYEGSIVVVYEVASADISLEQMVDKFTKGEVKLSYPIIDVSSETSEQEIDVIKDGKVTQTAQKAVDQWERDKKVNLIFFILGFSVLMMFVFSIVICIRQKAQFDNYKGKHISLTNLDSARSDIEKK